MSSEAPPETRQSTREALLSRLDQEGMLPIARAALIVWLVAGLLALSVAGIWVLYQVKAIFPPLVLALALIFLLNPIVSRLEKRGVKRGIGTGLIYIIFLGVVFLVGLGITPLLRRQLQELVDQIPILVESGTKFVEALAERFGISTEEQNVRELLSGLQGQIFTGIDQVTRFAGGAAHLVLIFILAPIMALYLLVDLPRLQRAFTEHLPPAYRDEWLHLLRRCGAAVGGFFRGQLVVAAIVAAMSSVALLIAGIPFWLPIGIVAGFFNIIPFIGPWVGAVFAIIVGAATGGWELALKAGIAMLIVQQIDNHAISPNVIGRALRLHPVTIILALLAGGTIAGLWGMLLAVPGTAVAKIVIMHYYSTHVLGRSVDDMAEEEAARPRKRLRDRVRGWLGRKDESIVEESTGESVAGDSPGQMQATETEPEEPGEPVLVDTEASSNSRTDGARADTGGAAKKTVTTGKRGRAGRSTKSGRSSRR